MEVYVEYVIIDNLLINALIIFLTSSLLKIKFNKINILLSSLLGTAFALIMPFITLNSYLMFVLKMVIGLAMVLVLKKFTLKKFIITFITFVSITFMMGGMCFGIMYLFNIEFTLNGIMLYGFEFPMSLFLICIFGYLYLATKIIAVVRNERKTAKSTYKIVLTCHGKEYPLTGFLDTGNMVYDNGKPVIILGYRAFKKIFKNIELSSLITNRISSKELEDAHYINMSSANNNSQMLVFQIAKLEITDTKETAVYNDINAGLSYKNFNNFDCLLHPDFF